MDDEKRPARITEVLGVTPKGRAWLDQETARRREEVSVVNTPQWPDGGAHPPVGFVLPQDMKQKVTLGGEEFTKHECPPDRVAMLARLEELQKGWDTRLANQRQVIENLDEARKAALAQLAAWQEFGRFLASDRGVPGTSLALKATELLRQQGVE